ncbi:hypothetical protein ACOSP7_030373 [Xanthoceras sorbifolium]
MTKNATQKPHCFSLIPLSSLTRSFTAVISLQTLSNISFSKPVKGSYFYLHTSPKLVQQHSHLSLSLFLFFSSNPSFSFPGENPIHPIQLQQSPTKMLKFIDCFLRLSVIPLSVATIWLTVTNQQDNSSFGKLKFNNILGLKYMVCISAICAGYAFVAAVSSCIRFLVSKAWLFFLSDQIAAYLMVTSGAAVMEIIYLAYNGDQKVTWSEACSSYGKFCYKMKLALIFHALALVCFIVLAVISAYRCFSMFAPPPVPSKEVEEEQRT